MTLPKSCFEGASSFLPAQQQPRVRATKRQVFIHTALVLWQLPPWGTSQLRDLMVSRPKSNIRLTAIANLCSHGFPPCPRVNFPSVVLLAIPLPTRCRSRCVACLVQVPLPSSPFLSQSPPETTTGRARSCSLPTDPRAIKRPGRA